ncbi:MAG: ABC transporter permease [Deltaproteobacteria bacterium]|nr:ABC transporter permease [Deltaproteobacteria bacterium]
MQPLKIQKGSATLGMTPTADGGGLIELAGPWLLESGAPTFDSFESALARRPELARVAYDASQLGDWDSAAVSFLVQTSRALHARGIVEDRSGLPSGLQRLIALAQAVPERAGARGVEKREPLLTRIGAGGLAFAAGLSEYLSFIGQCGLAFTRLLVGKARYRGEDFLVVLQACGASALGIVALISFLVGAILAFMGAVQLQQFGASIYVADLVAIGMAREMGAMMTAIIMSGRTGAAFAAQLGSMKVSQEIDALTTMGISPFEYLVLPRMMALILMMPLLCTFSDIVGMLGGAAVGVGMLDVPFGAYYRQTIAAVSLTNFFGGLFKSAVYGALIAMAGCLYGFKSGSSSSAVGDAATRAVVSGIVMIVLACGIFAVIFNVLHI